MAEDTVDAPKRAIVTIEQRLGKVVIPELDESDYLGLGKQSSTRADLMLFAFALGWAHGLSAPTQKPFGGGLARTESFSEKLNTLIKTVHLDSLGIDHIDGLADHGEALSLFESYVNGGLGLIEGEIEEKVSTEERANTIVAELDRRYNELFGRQS